MRRVFNQKGSVSVEFLIVGMLVLFLVFAASDYWLIQVKQQACEHLKNYYLDRIRVEGYLTVEDENEMQIRFTNAGCPLTEINAPMESKGDSRVLRTTDPTSCDVWLEVEAEPDIQPFIMGTLLGASDPGEYRIKVGGRSVSERVDP